MIPNNYKGKTVTQVWDEWTNEQRLHFIRDHVKDYSAKDIKWAVEAAKHTWKNVPEQYQVKIASQLYIHVTDGQYARGGDVNSDIKKYKKALIAKAKSKGLYENFGQKEVGKLENKYGRTNEVAQFDEWAMNFDLSQIDQYAHGGSVQSFFTGIINWLTSPL